MRPSKALQEHRDAIRAVLLQYPVDNPRVFGSVVRGEDTDASDLDILVSLRPHDNAVGGLTLFDLAKLELRLQAMIGVPVDIRLHQGLSERAVAKILEASMPL